MRTYFDFKTGIEACLSCAAICNHCAASCAQEEDVKRMAKCIQLNMECASICYSAAQLMSLGSNNAQKVCRICAKIADACTKECRSQPHQHCQECARLCKICAEECRKMAA